MPLGTIPSTEPDREVRHGVGWAEYCRLRDDPALDKVRMAYLDGTLVMSPLWVHDQKSRRLFHVVNRAARASRVRVLTIGSTTMRRDGLGPLPPAGKEADETFYLGDAVAAVIRNTDLDLDVDPPPSLAIEVDNTVDTSIALPIYARIGVPEVWIYRVADPSVRFLALRDGGYAEVDRSLGLPRLTPALVTEALVMAREEEMDDIDFCDWLDAWAGALPDPPA